MAFRDFREFLRSLEGQGQLQHLDLPLSCGKGNNDLQPLMRYLHSTKNIALILDNLKGHNIPGVPLAFNPFGSRERTAMTIGLQDPLEAKKYHAGTLADRTSWKKPVVVKRNAAPCKDIIIAENEVSLKEQIPHVWFGREGPAFITNGLGITKDPETGATNVGWYRVALLWNADHPEGGTYTPEQQETHVAVYAFWNPPMSHIGLHLAKANRLGRPLEVAFACSCDPAVHLAAATGLPYGENEYDFAGGLRRAPVEVVSCETVDLDVPATAEYVLEGELLSSEEVPIGWHSSVAGYYDKSQIFPLMKVKCITHRRNPMWYATMEMVPPFDHNYIGMLPVEGELLSDLQRKIPEVQDVVVTPAMSYIVQLSVDGATKPHPEFGKYILHAVWGAAGRWGRTAKLVIVVGPDVDPYDYGQVNWAIMSRVQPYSDTIINRSGQAFVDDPSAPKTVHGFPVQSEQMGIDATIKVPERFDEYPEVSQADPADVARIANIMRNALA